MKPGVLIIAEAGVNHNGDINMAKQLIEIAASCKVDFVKFQTWITEENIEQSASKAAYQEENDGTGSQYDMCKRLELSFEDFKELKKFSESLGVKFLSTPDEAQSLNFLIDELDLPIIKIGSGEINNIPFLRKVGKKGKRVILSTGMSTLGEVEKAYNTLLSSGAESVALLHCTTSYPAPMETINLNAMDVLRNAFKTEVGYSDHTEGIEISVAAVAMGASIIEKHFTIDKSLSGPDHKASLDPTELNLLVKQIRNVEKAISGSGKKEIQNIEIEVKEVISKGIYIRQDLFAGEILREEHFVYKRPSKEISTKYFDLIVNKKLRNNIQSGSPLKWDDVIL